jgi:hypothetical protein
MNMPHSLTEAALTSTPAIVAPYASSPEPTTSASTTNTAICPALTETRYLKDNSNHHYQHHPQPHHTASEASDMVLVPELILSTLLQSQVRKNPKEQDKGNQSPFEFEREKDGHDL